MIRMPSNKPSLFAGLHTARLIATREALVLLLYAAVCAMTLNVFMQSRSFEEGNERFGFGKMIEGTAHRPFVYRQLLPLVARLTLSATPEAERQAFVQYHLDKHHLRQRYFGRARYAGENTEEWTPAYSIAFHTIYLIDFASLLGLCYLLRRLLLATGGVPLWLSLGAPICFVLLLPLTFMHGGYFYDFPELFFLAALMLAALKGRYLWWVLLLPVAVLNKESSILVPLLYLPLIVTTYSRTRPWQVALAVVLASVVFLAVRSHYAGNPGDTMEWHLDKNLTFWLNPASYFLWHDFYAPLIPFPRGANLLLLALLLSVLAYGWRHAPLWLKQTFLISAVVNVLLFLAFCYRDEVRNLSFLFIPVFLIVSAGVPALVTRITNPKDHGPARQSQ